MAQQLNGTGGQILNSGSSVAASPARFDNSLQLASTAFVKSAGGNFSGSDHQTTTTPLPLTIADVGKLISIGGTPVGTRTVTLPDATLVPIGANITLWVVTTDATTVNTNNANDRIAYIGNAGGALTTLGLKGECGIVVFTRSAIGNVWFVTGEGVLPVAGSSGLFGSAQLANGYQRLPSGIIIQWGNHSIAANTDTTFALPVPFPNAFVSVVSTSAYTVGSGVNNGAIVASQVGLNQLCLRCTSVTNGMWFAIGY